MRDVVGEFRSKVNEFEERLRCKSRSNSTGSNCVPSASVTREIRSKESEGNSVLHHRVEACPGFLKSQLNRRQIFRRRNRQPTEGGAFYRGAKFRCRFARPPNCTQKIKFSFLNGSLMVPAGPSTIFNSDGNACGSKQRWRCDASSVHQAGHRSSC